MDQIIKVAQFSIPRRLLLQKGGGLSDDFDVPMRIVNGHWVDVQARRLGVWMGSNVVLLNLDQQATGLIVQHGLFSTTTKVAAGGGAGGGEGGGSGKKEEVLVDVHSLTYATGVALKYTHMIGLTDDQCQHHSLPLFTVLACGKGPFVDVLTTGSRSHGGSGVLRVLHSWDLRKLREGLPSKLKIYDLKRHGSMSNLMCVGTNVGVFVLDIASRGSTDSVAGCTLVGGSGGKSGSGSGGTR